MQRFSSLDTYSAPNAPLVSSHPSCSTLWSIIHTTTQLFVGSYHILATVDAHVPELNESELLAAAAAVVPWYSNSRAGKLSVQSAPLIS